MKRHLLLLGVCFVVFLFPGVLQAQLPPGMSVTCDNGSNFDNGVEVSIYQLRTGFSYTATAIGINGFDPVLAVLDTNTGKGLCSDDDSGAANYAADLPTTGVVPASSTSAQINFTPPNTGSFADVSLVVGGYGNQSGEFLLILEGMGVTSGDGAGDPFSVNVTPGMVDSGVPLTVYMLARDTSLDPTIFRSDSSSNAITDSSGNVIGCDDAGNSDICWGNSTDLSNSSLTIAAGRLPGGPYDAMLSLPLTGVTLNSDRSQNYYNFAMTTSPQNATTGQYVLAFHIGMAESTGKGTNFSGGQESSGGAETVPTPVAQGNSGSAQNGVNITCDDGTSFDNGVQIFLYDVPSNVTFTATAIGLNDFDPVLVVVNSNGDGLCSDDASGAATYAADLPTTGSVPASERSAQVVFTQDSGKDTDTMSLIVGGYGGGGGEFLLILEGMEVAANSKFGDIIYDVDITPPMVNSGVPLTVYMITEQDSHLDPYIAQSDQSLKPLQDGKGNTIACDDAGSKTLCWGDSTDLSGSALTLGDRKLSGWEYDAMLSLDLTQTQFNVDAGQDYITYVLGSSPDNVTNGKYVVAFHIGRAS